MRKVRCWTVVWFAGLFFLPSVAFTQEDQKATKAQKKAEKKEAQRLDRERKADIKGKKRHYKLQDKKTRKKMKRHRRRVDQQYPSDRPGFFRRIFRKKHYYIFISPDREPLLLAAGQAQQPIYFSAA